MLLVPWRRYITTAVEVDPDKPVLVDKYLDRAIELDVDALRDKEGNIVICGIMEHIEQVGAGRDNTGSIWGRGRGCMHCGTGMWVLLQPGSSKGDTT